MVMNARRYQNENVENVGDVLEKSCLFTGAAVVNQAFDRSFVSVVSCYSG
jgi:hypothetical protein